MAIEAKPGQTVRITVTKNISREAARKTLIRLFMTDKAITGPLHARSRNFKALPKRRGGTIWTKRPNKIFPNLNRGAAATIKATTQSLKDLASVSDLLDISVA